MDKIIDITKILEKEGGKEVTGDTAVESCVQKRMTNPIYKKLVEFKNENLSKKFDIRDLFR